VGAGMSLTKQIEKLCHEVSEEKDGNKLLSLVNQLNRELARISEAHGVKDTEQSRDSVGSEQKKPDVA
jgi:hypothetical protein